MEQSIKAKLTNIFPLQAKEKTATPYITYRRISTDRWKTLQGQGVYEAIFEFNIVGKSYSEMLTAKQSVYTAFANVTGQYRAGGPYIQYVEILNDMDDLDNDTQYRRGVLEIKFIYNN